MRQQEAGTDEGLPAGGHGDGEIMGGLAKGLAVITAFDERHPRLTLSETARIAGLERATARRCLLTLVRLGYAHYDGKFYELSPGILRLGYAYLSATPLPRIVQPFLEGLARDTEESCSASILDGGDVVYVARAARRRVMSIGLHVGSRLPAYVASMGRVLLASLPEDEARALLARSDRRALTPKTQTGVDALLEELRRVRVQGYAVIDEELEIGLRSIAVPVCCSNGKVVAAINVGAQAVRVSVDTMVRDFLPRMLVIQHELRRQLA